LNFLGSGKDRRSTIYVPDAYNINIFYLTHI
jgi:hypothetical protein